MLMAAPCHFTEEREPIALMACIIIVKDTGAGRENSLIDEQDAIRRCQMGDRESFRPIVERYGNVLMGTIYLMVRDRAISEELVQETFVRAWNGITTFRLGRPLKPWLVRIAVNQALNARARHQVPVEPLSAANEGSGTDQGFGQSDEQHEIRQALSRLSAEHRRVVVLRYYGDLSTRETADALGIREGTVKSRLARALEQLREIMGS